MSTPVADARASGNAKSLLQAANTALRAGDLSSAINALERALEIDANNAVAWRQLASACARSADGKKTVHALQNLLRLTPDDFASQLYLGVLQMRLGDARGAEAALRIAASQQPPSGKALLHLAHAVELQGRLEEAAELLLEYTQATPADDRVQVRRGILLARLGRHQEAEAVFAAGLAANPANTGAAVQRAAALAQLNRSGEARVLLGKVLSADPANLPAIRHLVDLLRLAGRPSEAAVLLRPAAHGNAGLLKLLGQLEDQRGDWTAAEEQYRAAIAVAPDDTGSMLLLAVALIEQGRHAEAAESRAQAAALIAESLPLNLDEALKKIAAGHAAGGGAGRGAAPIPDRGAWTAEARRSWGQAVNALMLNWAVFRPGGNSALAPLAAPPDTPAGGRTGTILIGSHIGAAAPIIARVMELTGEYRIFTASPHYLASFPGGSFVRAKERGAEQALAKLAACLRRGGTVYIAADERVGRMSERLYTVGGRQMRLPLGPAALAFATGAPAYWYNATWGTSGLDTRVMAAPRKAAHEKFDGWCGRWLDFTAARLNEAAASGPENHAALKASVDRSLAA